MLTHKKCGVFVVVDTVRRMSTTCEAIYIFTVGNITASLNTQVLCT